MSHPLYTNRLINEKSPYLLQHAHNPVDWYPWGEEAFNAAKELDKPIFLSIGYATCHWCHMMEEESFSNLEVAQLMNDSFVNIKIDCEEKPDVDALYMEFAQAMMSGGAGWPLNLILTPELMPFFATTYLPPDAKHGLLGLKQLVSRIHQIWSDPEERETIIAQAGKIVDVFSTHTPTAAGEFPKKEIIKEAAELLYKSADPIYGGVKGAPKFPVGLQACFLLRYARETSDGRALFYVERSLEMMHRGGIYDHLGGGFSRYSIDEQWLVPHFEKMLYDNAFLARAYLETWEYTRQSFYREVAEHILAYILRDMNDPRGGFYSAEDADSEGQEGHFYTWTESEIHSVLERDAPLFCEFYGVTPRGIFEGRNILHMHYSLEEFSSYRNLDQVVVKKILDELRKKLWEAREKRPHPFKDDKIITAWNGLAIYILAKAGMVINQPLYLEAAAKAATFIKDNLYVEGTLLRRWREEEARFDGCLDDYAFFIHGLLSLFEADQGSEWLEFALRLTHDLKENFKNEQGAFYLNNGKDPNLILRRSEFYDGAEPSGNAIHCENLIRLYQITGVDEYMQEAEGIFKAAKEHIDIFPPGACYHLMTLQRYYDLNAPTLIVALNEKEELKEEIAKMLSGHFIPHKVVIWRRSSDEELRDLVPQSRGKEPINNKTALYICFRNHCSLPITELSEMWKTIENLQ
ncbi:MAG: thioredoxin domain-containing protein [Chlamydiales bacterium]